MVNPVRSQSGSSSTTAYVSSLSGPPANESQAYRTTPQPDARQRQQRQAVKAIARDCDVLARVVNNTNPFSASTKKMDKIIARLTTRQQELRHLEAAGLSHSEPAPSTMRSARSGVVLAAGAVTRAGALLSAGAVAAVEVGLMAAAYPVAGVINGAVAGFERGLNSSIIMARPLTAVAGLGLGAAAGGIGGVINMPIVAPATAVMPGSFTRKTYVGIDFLTAARKHAKRKNQSTSTIAQTTANKLENTLTKAERNRSGAQLMNNAPAILNEMINEHMADFPNDYMVRR